MGLPLVAATVRMVVYHLKGDHPSFEGSPPTLVLRRTTFVTRFWDTVDGREVTISTVGTVASMSRVATVWANWLVVLGFERYPSPVTDWVFGRMWHRTLSVDDAFTALVRKSKSLLTNPPPGYWRLVPPCPRPPPAGGSTSGWSTSESSEDDFGDDIWVGGDAPSQGSDDGSDSDAPASSASGDDEEPGSAGPPTDGGSSSDDESSDETHLSRSRSRSRSPRDPPPPPHDSDDESAQWSQWTTGPASQRAASQWATPPPPTWVDALRHRLRAAAPVDAANAACLAYAADERALPPTTNGDVDVLFAPEEESWD